MHVAVFDKFVGFFCRFQRCVPVQFNIGGLVLQLFKTILEVVFGILDHDAGTLIGGLDGEAPVFPESCQRFLVFPGEVLVVRLLLFWVPNFFQFFQPGSDLAHAFLNDVWQRMCRWSRNELIIMPLALVVVLFIEF